MVDFKFDKNTQRYDYLKVDILGKWIEREWVNHHTQQNLQTIWTSEACVNAQVLEHFDLQFELPEGYRYLNNETYLCPVVPQIWHESHQEEGISFRSGAFLYHFEHPKNGTKIELLVVSAFTSDEFYDNELICLASMPADFVPVWQAFAKECRRISWSLKPKQQVYIIGGRERSFTPDTEWDNIILPEDLKQNLLDDVQMFFDKGISVYKRLKLRPFRKLLLAGVPGTGKTMICSAMAKWAVEKEYLVIYVSSADDEGATFRKIQRALDVAARSDHPALLIIEELDAYLRDEEKALVLNVLDGSESAINEHGTLLIATTNYPEAIDERVLKRPGRLDRIFIIPEMRREEDTEKMLRLYLDTMWQDDHKQIAKKLVGYPGAFIREVAIYALTQVAQNDLDTLSLDLLSDSFNSLRKQIEMRDDFLIQRGKGIGFNRD